MAHTSVFASQSWHKVVCAIGVAVMVTFCAVAEVRADVEGVAKVVDGDTIKINGKRIRLHGIDAPERNQQCGAGTTLWACGEQATLRLTALAEGRPVVCKGNKHDRYGRLIAVCYVGETDLNAAMVRGGWALAYRRYAKDYIPAEQEARAAGRGMWRGSFVPPWEWRRAARLN